MTDPELLAEFDRRFHDNPDPWAFETSAYEQRKRAATVEACGDLHGCRVLELGAANGVLAADLAPSASELVAVEAVPEAARLAAERLARWPQASVTQGLIPADVPGGPYDVVVASEILYYLDHAAYERALVELPGWLAAGGRVVAVHWRPTSSERPRSAEDVHADLAAHPALALVTALRDPEYLLSVLVADRTPKGRP